MFKINTFVFVAFEFDFYDESDVTHINTHIHTHTHTFIATRYTFIYSLAMVISSVIYLVDMCNVYMYLCVYEFQHSTVVVVVIVIVGKCQSFYVFV